MTDKAAETEDARDRSKTSHIDKPLGDRLRLQRDARKLTRAQLAKMLDLSDSGLQHYEDGEVRIPASRLWQICNLLDIEVTEFFDDLPYRVKTASGSGLEEEAAAYVMNDGRGKMAAAIARAASKLPTDRLEIAVELVKALKPKP